jgi:deoxycytidine triphosphate deaminase
MAESDFSHFLRTLENQEGVLRQAQKIGLAIVNPREILDQGYVRPFEGNPDIITDSADEECALQQNGIDLRLDTVQVADGATRFSLYKKKDTRCTYYPLEPNADNDFLFFPGKQYAVDFFEEVEIPVGLSAYVFVRSSINRYSGMLLTGYWDSGFKGRLGGVFRPYLPTTIERGCRMAQIVFYRSDSAKLYKGQYQNQKTQI